MRARALILWSLLPLALAAAPSTGHAQTVYRDCWNRSTWYGSSFRCGGEADVAAAQRRADAAAARAEARARTQERLADNRAVVAAQRAEARANARAWSSIETRRRVDERAVERPNAAARIRERLDERRFETRVRRIRDRSF
jgi:hypothetical protein